MGSSLRIWHFGLVARWWAEFNQGGDDVAYFRDAISRSGEPALDAGCGTGRLLLPFLRDGLDVDGTDASADMLHLCQAAAQAEGLRVALHTQAMHELALPRRYRTIVVCGAFGLGARREDDLEGLVRIHAHLEPRGTLLLDYVLPTPPKTPPIVSDTPKRSAREWPEEGDRRRARDGSELELRIRLRDFDRQRRTVTREICVRQLIDDQEVASDTHAIDINLYTEEEITSLLRAVGFSTVRVTGELEDRPVRPGADQRIVFHATP